MILNHLAAILFFAGPLFYCGMWMAIAPAGAARVIDFGMQALRVETPGKTRTAIRWVGVVLALIAIAI